VKNFFEIQAVKNKLESLETFDSYCESAPQTINIISNPLNDITNWSERFSQDYGYS